MADKKISQLPAATTPLAGTEVLPLVQSGSTVKVSVANLTDGKAISATQYTSTIETGTAPFVVASTTEVANLKAATATLADSATSANAVKSNATTGLLQVTGPAAASTRVMTTPDANFTAARTDAGQTFTGNQTINGNVSLNIAPSTWSQGAAIEVGFAGNAYHSATQRNSVLSQNAYFNSGWKYASTNAATIYSLADGIHTWHTSPSGTAGNPITFTQAMALDSSGNLGLGVTPSAWYSTTNYVAMQVGSASIAARGNTNLLSSNAYASTTGGGWKYINTDYATSYQQSSGSHYWLNAPSGTAGDPISFTQAMTLDTSGNLLVGTPSGSYKITCNGQPGANGYTAWTNYSDERLKENIVDFISEPVLDKVCQLHPVSFNYNDKTGFDEETRQRKVSGFIAQELQKVFPDMVGEASIGEENYFDTNLSNLNLYLVAAIQELHARIKKLEAK